MDSINSQDCSTEPVYAAIDLGSNSFHLAIGKVHHHELRWVERRSEKVQLAAGINAENCLDAEVMERAILCLQQFQQRITHIPTHHIRIVGTKALRSAKNANILLAQIEQLFGQRAEIISGREEARLIYLGVSHSIPLLDQTNFVVDIGGGSTEFILGSGFNATNTESLHIGCVTFKQTFFTDGKLSQNRFSEAVTATRQQLQLISKTYLERGWNQAIGSSGSIKAILQAICGFGIITERITRSHLEMLIEHILAAGKLERVKLLGVKPERWPLFPSGLAILYGIFLQLKIESMVYSEGALREGLIYDLLGRHEPENIQNRTLTALEQRYSIPTGQAERVRATALYLFDQLKPNWPDTNTAYFQQMLENAAQLHEIGLSISHSQFHKHGGYIIEHSDLAGFSKHDQQMLSCLIRLHRRKINLAVLELLEPGQRPIAFRLIVILRLSVALNHCRDFQPAALCKAIRVESKITSVNRLAVTFTKGWLEQHPLVQADLEVERQALERTGFNLEVV